jgi:hypothetical protein
MQFYLTRTWRMDTEEWRVEPQGIAILLIDLQRRYLPPPVREAFPGAHTAP